MTARARNVPSTTRRPGSAARAQGRAAREEVRHLAGGDLGAVRGPRARGVPGPRRSSGCERGDTGGGHLRQPAGLALRRSWPPSRPARSRSGSSSTACPIRCSASSSTARRASSSSRTRSRPTRCSSVRDALPRLERIVVDDMRGLEDYRRPDARRASRSSPRQGRALDGRRAASATRSCSSAEAPPTWPCSRTPRGPRVPPKAAMISHRNLLAMAAGVTAGRSRSRERRDRLVPAVLLGGRAALERGHRAARGSHRELPRGAGDAARGPAGDRAARDDRPAALLGSHVLGVPGEDRRRRVPQAGGDAGGPRASASGWPRRRLAARPRASPGARCTASRYLLAFRALLDKLGLSRVRYAYTGGAPLGAGDLPVLPRHRPQPQAGVRPDRDLRHLRRSTPTATSGPETVGKPTPGTRIRISDAGEILVASESVFLGYYKNPEATAQALDDGWLHTGDAGLVDERRPPGRDRPAHGRAEAGRRLALLAGADREQAQVQPLRARGGGDRRGPALRGRADPDRHGQRGQLGGGQSAALHHVQGSLAQARGLDTDRRRRWRASTRTCPPSPGSADSRCSTRSSTPTTTS